MTKPTPVPKPVLPPERPTAVVRIAPVGPLERVPRDYLIAVELAVPRMGASQDAHAHARSSLSGVSSDTTATDRPTVRDIRTSLKPTKDGVPVSAVTGVEAEVLCAGEPDLAIVTRIRSELAGHGYRVTTQERRACSEPGCSVEALVEPARRTEAPGGWYSDRICGRHNYRACTGCTTVFRFVSSASSGQAPAVHCPICSVVLVEWGGSKLWEVELVGASRVITPERDLAPT